MSKPPWANREIAAVTVNDHTAMSMLTDRKEVTAALHAYEKAKLTVCRLEGIDDLAGMLEYTDNQIAQRYAPPAVSAPAGKQMHP